MSLLLFSWHFCSAWFSKNLKMWNMSDRNEEKMNTKLKQSHNIYANIVIEFVCWIESASWDWNANKVEKWSILSWYTMYTLSVHFDFISVILLARFSRMHKWNTEKMQNSILLNFDFDWIKRKWMQIFANLLFVLCVRRIFFYYRNTDG